MNPKKPTDRLTEAEIRALRSLANDHRKSVWHGWTRRTNSRRTMNRLLDEIEERRRIDARRRKDFIAKRNDPELDAVEIRALRNFSDAQTKTCLPCIVMDARKMVRLLDEIEERRRIDANAAIATERDWEPVTAAASPAQPAQ